MKAAPRIMYQRLEALKLADELTYAANNLNQYTGITRGEGTPFVPAYDANNRPVSFTRAEGETTTVVECGYDYQGRRYMKKVTVNGTVTLYHRYLYRGYLQIACCDLTRAAHPCLWLITWDPAEPVATRPLAIQKDGTWYCYGLDITKNVWELFGSSGYIRTAYDYTPYGGVTEDGDVTQPVQWSSEVYDAELAMVYYNYRHYNPMDGRWINRDPIGEQGGWNLYAFMRSNLTTNFDWLGKAFYGVQTIPQILRKNSFFDAARFMDHWFASTGKTLYENLDKLLSTARVREKYDELLTAATNQAAQVKIREKIAAKNPGDRLYDNTPTAEIIKKEHVQFRVIESGLSDTLDDFYAAYGTASLYAVVDGCIYTDSKINQKKIDIDKLYVTLYDQYNFNDRGFWEEQMTSQWLGYYDTTTNYVGRNPIFGTLVQNMDFIMYKKRTGKGKDFEIYTTTKSVSQDPPVNIG